jgi:hypothetical protein
MYPIYVRLIPPADKEDYNEFNVNLVLLQPVQTETLVSLLKYPIKWPHYDLSIYHAITGIHDLKLKYDGAFLGSGMDNGDYPFRNIVQS